MSVECAEARTAYPFSRRFTNKRVGRTWSNNIGSDHSGRPPPVRHSYRYRVEKTGAAKCQEHPIPNLQLYNL